LNSVNKKIRQFGMDYVSYLLSNIFNCEERINLLNIFNLQLFTLDLLAR